MITFDFFKRKCYNKAMSKLETIGRDALVDLSESIKKVPAKVDTGADSSAIWASDIHIDEQGRLVFKLFGKGSEFYTGEDIVCAEYDASKVKSASGHIAMRFKAPFRLRINGREVKTVLGLSDRSTHVYPILIGRRTLKDNFVVDVSRERIYTPETKDAAMKLTRAMKEDFYKQHSKNNEEAAK